MRLTSTSYVVLALLDACEEESTPYELKQALERSIENFWPVPHSSFYAEPTRLAAAGYLSERQETTGRRRKLYALTDKGLEALREWASSPDIAPPQLRDEAILKIFAGADPQPILAARRDWHAAKLLELEGYLEDLQAGAELIDANNPTGIQASLLAGIAYNRLLLELVESYLTTAEPTRG
jgi:PadR family transcriptional regulator AphA